MIIGIRGVVIKMAVTFIKLALIFVIAYLYNTILYPKGVSIIVPYFIMVNLGGPIIYVLSIEHGNPTVVFFLGNRLYRATLAKK
jgi:hypothetical protein|tara:strand:+ start:828 stop:1079 length:252 start_codon:yes stop_codon:yes gene_type:complete